MLLERSSVTESKVRYSVQVHEDPAEAEDVFAAEAT